jgi:hypothetical protein
MDSQASGLHAFNKMRGHDLHTRVMRKIQETEKMRDVFRKFDDDKNGTIDHKEFGNGVRDLGFAATEKEVNNMLKVVDPHNTGKIEYRHFIDHMVEKAHGHAGAERGHHKKNHHTHAALRDNIGDGAGVNSSARHIKVGTYGVGEGHNATESRFQRDVGDRAVMEDILMFQGEEMGQGSHGTDGTTHVHQVDDSNFSTFEKRLRTPKYTRVNFEKCAMRISSPGMSRVISDAQYGDANHGYYLGGNTRVNLDDPFNRKTKIETLTERDTDTFRASSAITSGVKPVQTRSELFAKRRGEKYRALDQFKHESFMEPFRPHKVFQFVKDKPKNAGGTNTRMGDVRFDPYTGIDLTGYDRKQLNSFQDKQLAASQARYNEALVGRGT